MGSGRQGDSARAACGKGPSLEFAGGSCKRATQVIVGVAMPAWKQRTAEFQNGADIGQGCAAPEQILSDPFVSDTPVSLREALRNTQSAQASLIDVEGGGGSDRGILRRVTPGERGKRREQIPRLAGGFQQRGAARGHGAMSVEEFHKRGKAVAAAMLDFGVGESSQATQMAPIGAGRISAIALREFSADSGGDNRFQRCDADTHPSLEMAGAGLEHDTGLMSMGAHRGDDVWSRMIQIQQDIAAVERMAVGVEKDVETLSVASAQECHGWRSREQTSRPNPFAGARRSGLVVDQPDEVVFVRHGRELAANHLASYEESTIAHECDYGFKWGRDTIDFQRTVTASFLRVSAEGFTP